MTNTKAIETLEYIRHTGNGESSYNHDAQSIALDMAIAALKAPKQKWIPVSERLPEEIRTKGYGLCNVLVTHKYAGVARTSLAVFDRGKFYTNNNFKHNDISVVAWMPLPEPYKEGENNAITD